jgi:glycosyltransferase involved in cell wall biosynthesis
VKILYLTYSRDITGADLSMLSLAESIPFQNEVLTLSDGPLIQLARSRGIKISKISRQGKLLALSPGTSLITRLLSLWQFPLIAWEVGRVARGYDVIYVHAKKAVLFAAAASLLSRTRMVWHQRDIVHLPKSMPFRTSLSERLLVKTLNKFAVKIFSVSQAAAKTFIAAGGRTDLPNVILNGIDAKPFSVHFASDTLRAQLSIPAQAHLLGCFGQLLPWKGHSVLLEAMHAMPGVHLIVAGSAGSAYPSYENDLRNQAQRLGVTERVHFLGRRTDVPALMRSVNVIVHPSIEFDPCPRVVIEALHAGVPLIATDVGGVPELLTHEVHGLLIPPADATSLAAAALRLLNDKSLAQTLCANGQRHALQCLTLTRLVEDVQRELLAVSRNN